MKVTFTAFEQNPSGAQFMKIEKRVFVSASDFITVPAKDYIV